MKAKLLSLLYCAGITFLLLVVVYIIFRGISTIYIKKNRNKYFNKFEKECNKIKENGNDLSKKYEEYKKIVIAFELNKIIRCSNSVVSNSSFNQTKYFLKYSNIEKNLESLEKLDFISTFYKELYNFYNSIDGTRKILTKSMPLFIKFFSNKKRMPYIICEVDINLTRVQKPFLHFLYISPAGRSRHESTIVLNSSTIKELSEEISGSINKKGHAKLQRSIMTNDLREAIKKRDNYTCCECGNSVYKEPNLLLEVDHIIPVSKGGKTEASNLQTLCWRCNRSKGDK